MSTPFLAEIRIISFNYAPRGWAMCNGQILPIAQNQALFALLGTTYGGNGTTSFALPNFQGRTPLHPGAGFVLGQQGGEEAHILSISEMPAHNHPVSASSAPASVGSPANNSWPAAAAAYALSSNTSMNPASISSTGSSQPHNNLQPYLVLNFVIALQGIFPSQL
jgi:microcystin-dependent protein